MKILHTADWHLGKSFEGSEFDLIGEQGKLLHSVVEIARHEDVDVVVIAGDVFDSYSPSASARRLFYETVCELSDMRKLVIIIAGNHDSPEMLRAEIPLYKGRNIILSGTPSDDLTIFQDGVRDFEVEISGHFVLVKGDYPTAFFLLPYASEVRLREAIDGDSAAQEASDYTQKIARIMASEPPFDGADYIGISHLFMENGEETGSERQLILGTAYRVPLSAVPPHFNLMLLGHLHSYQTIGDRAVYSGALFPLSASEAQKSPEKFVVLADSNGHFEPITILPPNRVKSLSFNSVEDAISAADRYGETLVFLQIKTMAVTSENISAIKRAYGNNLITLRFSFGDEKGHHGEIDIKAMSHEEVFRRFYREKHGVSPDDELVRLFLSMLQQTEEKLNETV